MLQNTLITALTPLGMKTELNNWENQPFTTVWPDKLHQKTKDITRTIKKKPKRVRTAFSTDQLLALERTFSRYKYINSEERNALAKSLNIGEKCIKIWFQNRRMKEKRESSESSCESSSESVGDKSPSLSASPPLQVKPESSKTEYNNEYCHYNNTEYSYQLPAFYGVPQNMYDVQTQNVSTFYNDNNVYPTHYFPFNMNYSSVENNDNQYGREMNQYWTANHNSYYTPI